MSTTRDDVNAWFTYHRPGEADTEKFTTIRGAARDLANVLMDTMPDCADRDEAVLLLRKVVMVANAGIICEPYRAAPGPAAGLIEATVDGEPAPAVGALMDKLGVQPGQTFTVMPWEAWVGKHVTFVYGGAGFKGEVLSCLTEPNRLLVREGEGRTQEFEVAYMSRLTEVTAP